MLLSKISSRGSGAKSMKLADRDRRARKFEQTASSSSADSNEACCGG